MAEIEDQLTEMLSDPESMKKIGAVAKLLGSGGGISGIFGETSSDAAPAAEKTAGDRRELLLKALRAYVSPERGATVDRALNIIRISGMAKNALRIFGATKESTDV